MVTPGIMRVAEVAPGIGMPLKDHWYASGALPVAVTERLRSSPSQRVSSIGCAVIVGASRTVTTAAFVVAMPQSFETVAV